PAPRLAAACASPERLAFIHALLEAPDYRALHDQTQLDEAASALAAIAFAEQFAAWRKEQGGKGEEDAEGLAGRGGAARAPRRAGAEAGREVEAMHEAARALGLGPGCPGSNDPRAIAALYRRVRSSPALQRICALAGRFRRVAQSRQRQKASHGADEVVGVTLGGELAHLLPLEFVKLGDEDFELDALRRLAQRQAPCLQRASCPP